MALSSWCMPISFLDDRRECEISGPEVCRTAECTHTCHGGPDATASPKRRQRAIEDDEDVE